MSTERPLDMGLLVTMDAAHMRKQSTETHSCARQSWVHGLWPETHLCARQKDAPQGNKDILTNLPKHVRMAHHCITNEDRITSQA